MFERLIILGQKVSAKSQRILFDLNKHLFRGKAFLQKKSPFSSQQNITSKPSKIINLLRKIT